MSRFGFANFVWYVQFGLVNDDDLKRPLVPLKLAKPNLELHLGTIPGRVGWGRVGSGRLGPIVIIRLSQFNCNCNCLLELSLAMTKKKRNKKMIEIVATNVVARQPPAMLPLVPIRLGALG